MTFASGPTELSQLRSGTVPDMKQLRPALKLLDRVVCESGVEECR